MLTNGFALHVLDILAIQVVPLSVRKTVYMYNYLSSFTHESLLNLSV